MVTRERVTLTFEEFKECFGINEVRRNMISEAEQFIRTFERFGCRCIYVTGSFITTKELPNDLDLCVDMGTAECIKLIKECPEFFTQNGINKIKARHRCHIASIFDSDLISIADVPLNADRNEIPRPMIKLDLKQKL